MAAVRPPHRPTLKQKKPQHSGNGGMVLIMLLFTALLGGGGYFYYQNQQEQKEHAAKLAQQEAARIKKREAALKAAAEKAEREKAERERAAREKAEAEEAERRRAAEEEAERLRREQETTDTTEPDETPGEPEPPAPDEPTPEPEPEAGPYDAELPLTGTAGVSREANETYAAMVDHLIQAGDFTEFSRAFTEKIRAELPNLLKGEKLNYGTYRSSRNMMQAVDICMLTAMCGEGELQSLLKQQPNEPQGGQAFFTWLLRDKSRPLHTLMQQFALQEGRPQNMGHTLRTLYGIWKSCPPREREKYLNLALACSMVQPSVASSNGRLRNPQSPVLNMEQVFTYFRQADARHKLLTDIKKMSVERLLHVVDLRLTQSEIDWVHKNLSYSREKWGDAYGSIRYRMDRAANGKDPYVHYTFAELRKEGGVCMDQAYFCGTTAKCMGIPAIYTTGDGDRGGHAWVVLSVADNQWSQINNYGYTTGRFSSPCSGRVMHESVFLSQTKTERASKLEPAGDGIVLSSFLASAGCVSEARGAARYVASSFPTLTVAWENEIEVLESEGDEPVSETEWRRVHQELTRAGAKNAELTELAGKVQDAHLLSGKSAGAQKSAIDRTVRQLKHNMGDARADLVVETVERQAKLLADNGDFQGLLTLYRKQLKDYSARGDIFQQLLDAYMRHLTDMQASPAEWGRAAKEAEKLYSKGVQTNSGDYFKITKEVTIQKMVARCYAQAGNTKKAEKLAREAEERLQNAKSQY